MTDHTTPLPLIPSTFKALIFFQQQEDHLNTRVELTKFEIMGKLEGS